MKVILPASEVPEGALVTKIQGQKEYYMRRTIKVYTEDRQAIELFGQRLNVLVPANPHDGLSLSALRNDQDVVWHASEDELISFLQKRQDERGDK